MFTGWFCPVLGVGGWLLMITLWAAVIAVVVWAVSHLFPTGTQRRQAEALPDHPLGPAGVGAPAEQGPGSTDPAHPGAHPG